MSRSIHRPWIKNDLCAILSSTAGTQSSSPSLRNSVPKCVQIVAIREELNLLTISDGDVFIYAFLTEDAFAELTEEYSIDTLRYCLANVVDYCFSTPLQAAGNRDLTELSKITAMFPLVLHCFKVTYLGASDCTVIGNPTPVNNSYTVMNLVKPLLAKHYHNFLEHLAIEQFPIQKVLPDWEGAFDDQHDFTATRPLQKTDFFQPESQITIIEQLGSFDYKDIMLTLPGLIEDHRESERENGNKKSKGRNKRPNKHPTTTSTIGSIAQQTQKAMTTTATDSTVDGWTETIREDYEDYDNNKTDWSSRWGINMETQVASDGDSSAADAAFPTDSEEDRECGTRSSSRKQKRSHDQMIPLPPLTADQAARGPGSETQHSQWQGTLVDEDSQATSGRNAGNSTKVATPQNSTKVATPQNAGIPAHSNAVTPLIHAPYHNPNVPIPTPMTLVLPLGASSHISPPLELPSANIRPSPRRSPGPYPILASNRPNKKKPSACAEYGTGTQVDNAPTEDEGSDEDYSLASHSSQNDVTIEDNGSRITKQSSHSLCMSKEHQIGMSDSQTLFSTVDGSQLETQSSQDSTMQTLLQKLTMNKAGTSASATAHSPIAQAVGSGPEHVHGTPTPIRSTSKSSTHKSRSQSRSLQPKQTSPFAASMSPILSTKKAQATENTEPISEKTANSSNSTQLTASQGSQELPVVPTGPAVEPLLDHEIITQEERGMLFDWSSQYTSQFLYPATGSATVAKSQNLAAGTDGIASAVDTHAFVCLETAEVAEPLTQNAAGSSTAAVSSSSATAVKRSPALFQTTQSSASNQARTAAQDIPTPNRSHKTAPTPSASQRSADSYASPNSQSQIIIINNNDSAPNRLVSRSGRELHYKPPTNSQSSTDGDHSSSTESQYSVSHSPSAQKEASQQPTDVQTRVPSVLVSTTVAITKDNQLPPAGQNSQRSQYRMTSTAALLYSQSDSEMSTAVKSNLPASQKSSKGRAVQKEGIIQEEEEDVQKESEEDSPILHKRRLSRLLEEPNSSRKTANLNVSCSNRADTISSSSSNSAAAVPSSSSSTRLIQPITEDELVRMTLQELLEYVGQLQLPAHLTNFNLADWKFDLTRYLRYVIREMAMIVRTASNSNIQSIGAVQQSKKKQENEEKEESHSSGRRSSNNNSSSSNNNNSSSYNKEEDDSNESSEESDDSSVKPRKYQKLTLTSKSKSTTDRRNESISSSVRNTRSKQEKPTVSTRSSTATNTVPYTTGTAAATTIGTITTTATTKKNKKKKKKTKKSTRKRRAYKKVGGRRLRK